MSAPFEREKHIQFLLYHYKLMPEPYSRQDSNRLLLLYFVVAGLDLLDALDRIEHDKQRIIEYIYACQIEPFRRASDGRMVAGFVGDGPECATSERRALQRTHLTMTQCALLMLRTLGDAAFARVRRAELVECISALQSPHTGAFRAIAGDDALVDADEQDMRFVYSALVCLHLLLDGDARRVRASIDAASVRRYICASRSYEGGYAQAPFEEAHGGSTFCALGAAVLLGALDGGGGSSSIMTVAQRAQTIDWLVHRQGGGFAGRANKAEDTCYAHWCGASLALLGAALGDDARRRLRAFLLANQADRGGLSKHHDTYADILHTFFGLSGLALLDEAGVCKVNPMLVIRDNR